MSQILLNFRLFSEGSNEKPCWGIAFRRRQDIDLALDTSLENRPRSIQIEFPDGVNYIFGIRKGFWNKCPEFVDAQETTRSYPVTSWAIDKLGYTVSNKSDCSIVVEVVRWNQLLKIIKFQ